MRQLTIRSRIALLAVVPLLTVIVPLTTLAAPPWDATLAELV